jgi:hypothetical protein
MHRSRHLACAHEQLAHTHAHTHHTHTHTCIYILLYIYACAGVGTSPARTSDWRDFFQRIKNKNKNKIKVTCAGVGTSPARTSGWRGWRTSSYEAFLFFFVIFFIFIFLPARTSGWRGWRRSGCRTTPPSSRLVRAVCSASARDTRRPSSLMHAALSY